MSSGRLVSSKLGGPKEAAPTLSFVASATSTSNTITIPASSQAGDVAILFDDAFGGSTPSDVVPTGWTGIITEIRSGAARVRISYKILQSGDPGASISGLNSDVEDKVMLVFRLSTGPITTVSAEDWAVQLVATGTPSDQTVNASTDGTAPLVVFGMALATGSTAAFTSPAFDATVANSDLDLLVGYKIYNSAPQDHLVASGNSTNGGLASGFLELS
jgi:hypothetical protein